MNERIKKLLEYLKEDPDDPFLLYALALEYQKSDNLQAKKYFDQLLHDHPDYLGTYYQAGHFYEKSGKKDKALKIFEKGMAKAEAQNNHHILRELQEAYNNLLFDEE